MISVICIPTLTRYDLLARLCYALLCGSEGLEIPHIVILDNGGGLKTSKWYAKIFDYHASSRPELIVPGFNMGVAGSWNFFVKNYGQCIIANDDVVFSRPAVDCFNWASMSHPESIIFENTDKVAGFSTFYVNRPNVWMQLGGFDELFNPAYFEDNDCRYRLKLAGFPIRSVKLKDWSHDNSSTLATASDSYQRMHWCLYKRNKSYYIKKWGGAPGFEVYRTPFEK